MRCGAVAGPVLGAAQFVSQCLCCGVSSASWYATDHAGVCSFEFHNDQRVVGFFPVGVFGVHPENDAVGRETFPGAVSPPLNDGIRFPWFLSWALFKGLAGEGDFLILVDQV